MSTTGEHWRLRQCQSPARDFTVWPAGANILLRGMTGDGRDASQAALSPPVDHGDDICGWIICEIHPVHVFHKVAELLIERFV